MKKFILSLILFLLPFVSSWSQIYNFLATSYAVKEYNYSARVWNAWTPWYECRVNGVINLNSRTIIVYTKSPQIYSIVDYVGSYRDSSSSETLEWKVIDQDNDRGTVRLRKEKSNNIQLYVDFANIMWVYNIRILE